MERCDQCKYYTKLYVPPVKWFDNIPKDAYVCSAFMLEVNRVQWLGRESEGVGEGMCECFSRRDANVGDK